MIPTISVRQVRPCRICYNVKLSQGFAWQCYMGKTITVPMSSGDPSNCDSNFTRDEMQELINQHNATENAVENYK